MVAASEYDKVQLQMRGWRWPSGGGFVNIDERLDRLTVRHEALTQSVELLTIDIKKLAASGSELRVSVSELTLGVRGLMNVAAHHETRIEILKTGSTAPLGVSQSVG